MARDDERHAHEDAARSDRARRVAERASRTTALDPDDPEALAAPASARAEGAWDATQPHHPFPMLAETQAVSMAGLLHDDEDERDAAGGDGHGQDDAFDAEDGDGQDDAFETESGEGLDGRDGDVPFEDDDSGSALDDEDDEEGEDDDGEAEAEADRDPADESPDDPAAHPFVARDDDGLTFEIDEVEALPEDAGVLDLHEGASEFVPVEPRPHDDRG